MTTASSLRNRSRTSAGVRAGRRPRRSRLAIVGAVGAAALLAGCGIRATEGPINAGEPAKRPQGTATSPVLATHPIYLVRNGRPEPVLRGDAVDLPLPSHNPTHPSTADDPLRLSLIDRLLRELAKGPTQEEKAAGWTTRLPSGGVGLANPFPDDSPELVRLDVGSLGELDPLALGQVVCTIQRAAKADRILLAGRGGPGQPLVCATFQGVPAGSAGKPVPPTTSPSS